MPYIGGAWGALARTHPKAPTPHIPTPIIVAREVLPPFPQSRILSFGGPFRLGFVWRFSFISPTLLLPVALLSFPLSPFFSIPFSLLSPFSPLPGALLFPPSWIPPLCCWMLLSSLFPAVRDLAVVYLRPGAGVPGILGP